MFKVNDIVTIKNSESRYGIKLTECGKVIEVYPDGLNFAPIPCAKVKLENVILANVPENCSKSMEPFIKLEDLELVDIEGLEVQTLEELYREMLENLPTPWGDWREWNRKYSDIVAELKANKGK